MKAIRLCSGQTLPALGAAAALVFGWALPAMAAERVEDAQPPKPTVIVGKAVKQDTSRPLRDVERERAALTGFNVEMQPIVPRPTTDAARRAKAPAADRVDPLLQPSGPPLRTAAATPAPLFTPVEGLSDDDNAATVGTRIVPPDTNGDIGPNHYVQWINIILQVWDIARDGAGAPTGATPSALGPIPGNAVWAGFGGFCQTNNNGDPIVLYDDLADRWLLSQFSINQGIQCVAVSTTPDPWGPYHRYAFTVTPGGANDYPKLGVWTDAGGSQSAYTFTTRDFGGAGGSFSIGAGVMERDKILVGDPTAAFIKFSNPCTSTNCLEGTLPPHLEQGPPPPAGTCPTFFTYFDAAYDSGPSTVDGVRSHELCVDWDNLGSSTYGENAFIPGADFDRSLGNGFSDCISPVNGGEVLDCLAAFTMYRAQYLWHDTHASVLLNTTVDAGADRAGIRWGELRSTDGESGWAFFQEGTHAPDDGLERWMGSIAMDGEGNIALGYSVTGSSLFPSIRYATRGPADPPGTLAAEAEMWAGTGAQIGSANRWGDYSSMSVDPASDCTFWYTQEYYETTGSFDFKTRIGAFQILGCGCDELGGDTDSDRYCDDGNDSGTAGDAPCATGALPGDPCDDNCVDVVNDQTDTDGDGQGDACDDDDDNDGVLDAFDGAPIDPRLCRDLDGDGCDDCSQNPCPACASPWPVYTPDASNDGPDADGDGLCDAGDGILFTPKTTQYLAGFGVLYQQNAYRIAPGASTIALVTNLGMVGMTLDAIDEQPNGDLLFSVYPGGILPGTGYLDSNVIFRFDGSAVTQELRPQDVGIGLGTLNALDELGDGTYAVSVRASAFVRTPAGSVFVRPWIVYRLDPFGQTLTVLKDFGSLGFTDIDGVDVLPDGRIAVSNARTFLAFQIPGLSRVWRQNVYIWDPATNGVGLSFDLSVLGVQTNDGFTLIATEGPGSPF